MQLAILWANVRFINGNSFIAVPFVTSLFFLCNELFNIYTLIFWVIFIIASCTVFYTTFYKTTKVRQVIDFEVIDGDSIKIKTDINNDFQRNQLKNLECPDTRSSTKNKLLAKKFNISEKEVMQRGKDTKKFVVEFLKQHKSNITIEYDFLYTEDVWGRKYVRLYVEGQNLAQMLIDKEKCFFKENPKIFFVQNVGFSQRIIVLLQFALSLSPIVLLIFYIIKKTKLFHTHTEIIQFILKGLFLLLGVFVYTCVNLLCPISTFISTNWLFRILLVFFIYHSTYILIFYTKFLLNIDDNVAFALWWICIFLVYCACISNVKHCDDEQYARVHEYTYTCSFDYIF